MIRTYLLRPSLCGCEFSASWDDAAPGDEHRTLAHVRVCPRHRGMSRDAAREAVRLESEQTNLVHATVVELGGDPEHLGDPRIDAEGVLNIEARALPSDVRAALRERLPGVRFR